MKEAYGQMPGYRGWSALVDQSSDTLISVTYWADADSMRASDDAGAAMRSRLVSEGAQLVDVERFEDLIVERLHTPRTGTSARATQLVLPPERIDDLVSAMRQESLPQLKAQPGFRALLVSGNRETGKIVVSTVWESAEAREASGAAMSDERQQTTDRVGGRVESVESFEVVAVNMTVPAPA
jgi:heme-degrading monooxygenase HmoA